MSHLIYTKLSGDIRLCHVVQNSALVILHFSHILMSTKLINCLNFRQFGVKLFGNLALIYSVIWRYKVSKNATNKHILFPQIIEN